MVPPKKMSLQEFFSDESYGGSWADEEIDIASISVPIEKNRGYGYGGDSHYGAGGNRFGSGGIHGRSAFLDNGPPYIVKLSNIPVTSNDAFINDLFHSRFTPLVKFKILFDPFSQPLELGIVKKIAFVELPSFESQNKVSKWQDVVYKGSRRVTIEVADFNDFQQSMRFNQENHQELLRVEQTFLSSRPRFGHIDEGVSGRGRPTMGRSPGGMPLDNIPGPGSQHHFAPQLRNRRLSNNEISQPAPTSDNLIDRPGPKLSKPKPNPFGTAKPVDVLAHLHEIEKNIVTHHHTTMRAPWAGGNDQKPSVHGLLNSNIPDSGLGWNQTGGPKKSLADILGSSKAKDHTRNPRASSANSTPKPIVKKPTVLMKKPAVVTPEPQAQVQAQVQAKSQDLDGNVESTEAKLSQVSLKSEEKPELWADISSTENETEPKNDSSNPPALSEQLSTNTDASSTEKSGTKSENLKSLNENTLTRRSGPRRRSNRAPESISTSKNEDSQSSHSYPERRQRRSSNRTNVRPPYENTPARDPAHEQRLNVEPINKENDNAIPRNNRREPRARRPNRRQPTDKPARSVDGRRSADPRAPLEAVIAPPYLEGSTPGVNLEISNNESDKDSSKRGGRGRGHGRGRGSSRSGGAGSEARRNEGRDKAGDRPRKEGSSFGRKESQKLEQAAHQA